MIIHADPALRVKIEALEAQRNAARRERDVAKAQRDALRKRLQECVDAIAALPEDALGWRYEGGPYEDQYPDSWPFRDELLHHTREALAGLEEA